MREDAFLKEQITLNIPKWEICEIKAFFSLYIIAFHSFYDFVFESSLCG